MRVVVIGAGPTGIYSAKLLVENRIEVILLDAGRRNSEDLLRVDSYEFNSPSKLIEGVHRMGGGTNHWKGRISIFPRTAIESLTEKGLRAWPIEWNEIELAYARVTENLEVTPVTELDLNRAKHVCEKCESKFGLSLFQFIQPDSFVQLFERIEQDKNLTFRESTFCELIEQDQLSSKLRLKCKRRNDVIEDFSYEVIETDFVIVAGGCLQSTTLIYRSFPQETKIMPIGRYLQEHFDGYIGRLHIRRNDYKCLKGLALTEKRSFQEMNFGFGIRTGESTKLHWHLEITPLARVYTFDPVSNRFNLGKKQLKILFVLERLITGPLFRAAILFNKFLGRETYSLWLKGEEFGNMDSMVYADRYEPTKVIYEHKVSRETRIEMKKEVKTFDQHLRKNRLGKIKFSPHVTILGGVNTGANWHPLGSLRMHASEEKVVNDDATMIFDNRIMCVDSSVFATGAHHNPTAMAVTLADIAVRKLLSRIQSIQSSKNIKN
jgi:choline dehydrogenase-like flavoprotein